MWCKFLMWNKYKSFNPIVPTRKFFSLQTTKNYLRQKKTLNLNQSVCSWSWFNLVKSCSCEFFGFLKSNKRFPRLTNVFIPFDQEIAEFSRLHSCVNETSAITWLIAMEILQIDKICAENLRSPRHQLISSKFLYHF